MRITENERTAEDLERSGERIGSVERERTGVLSAFAAGKSPKHVGATAADGAVEHERAVVGQAEVEHAAEVGKDDIVRQNHIRRRVAQNGAGGANGECSGAETAARRENHGAPIEQCSSRVGIAPRQSDATGSGFIQSARTGGVAGQSQSRATGVGDTQFAPGHDAVGNRVVAGERVDRRISSARRRERDLAGARNDIS